MVGYLENVRPTSEEIVVDEMLAISSEIDAWRDKKAAEEANARYNDIIRNGLTYSCNFDCRDSRQSFLLLATSQGARYMKSI